VLSLLGHRTDRNTQQLCQQPCRFPELLLGIPWDQPHLAAELVAAAVHHRHLQQRLAVVIEAAAGGVGKAQAEGAAGGLDHRRQAHLGRWHHLRLEACEGLGQLAFGGSLAQKQGRWIGSIPVGDRLRTCGGPRSGGLRSGGSRGGGWTRSGGG
jgi:hypothetical protein